MKVLIGIWHPAHVHFFRNTILNLQKDGHKVQIVTRNKEMTLELLDAYNFEYINMGKHHKSTLSKGFNLLSTDYKLYKIAKKFQPDVLIGIMDMYSAHVGKLINKPVVIFSDTEHGNIYNKLTFPFATAICTPSCYKKDLGPKQIRYNGYHELAYLHPNYFEPDPSVLDELELKEGERFIIMRFVAWDANHDAGHKGISMEMRRGFVSELEKYGRVLITSESELPAEFEPYRVKVAPEKMHDLLYYAALYVGEGGTMASESGILGTPSVYISSLVGTMGNFEELEGKYGLVYSYSNHINALKSAINILEDKQSKEKFNVAREQFFDETIDVTSYIINIIENIVQIEM